MEKEKLLRYLGQCPYRLQLVEETGSTNSDLKEDPTAQPGTVRIALRQRSGRGRMGRSFLSPEGGLYLSVLLRPCGSQGQLLSLTTLTAVAVRRGIQEACGLSVGLKWVNDLVYGGKKVGGILTELVTGAEGRVQRIVVGLGLNCSGVPAQMAHMAASLEELSGRPVEREKLAAAILKEIYAMEQLAAGERRAWMQEYAQACVTLGKEVRLLREGRWQQAYAVGVDELGGLRLRYPDGREDCISTGEVSVRGMYGYTE